MWQNCFSGYIIIQIKKTARNITQRVELKLNQPFDNRARGTFAIFFMNQERYFISHSASSIETATKHNAMRRFNGRRRGSTWTAARRNKGTEKGNKKKAQGIAKWLLRLVGLQGVLSWSVYWTRGGETSPTFLRSLSSASSSPFCWWLLLLVAVPKTSFLQPSPPFDAQISGTEQRPSSFNVDLLSTWHTDSIHHSPKIL